MPMRASSMVVQSVLCPASALLLGALIVLHAIPARADTSLAQGNPAPLPEVGPQPPASAVAGAPAPVPTSTGPSWLDLDKLPFIPVPELDEDPYSGTSVGLIPTVLVTNDQHQIEQIIAPDVIHSQYFGWGARARFFDFPSDDTQWSLVGGAKQHVESEFDGEYATGMLRDERWSFSSSLIYDRDGSPRFYGVGNDSQLADQTNFTDQQKYAQTTLGLNLSHIWQIGYEMRLREVTITPGHIPGVPSIQDLYPTTVLKADRREFLNRLYVNYDSRDDVNIPTRGAEWIAYAGAASTSLQPNTSLYSEVGLDGRNFFALPNHAVLAMHVALRYMPRTDRTRNIPFWALSGLGGDESDLGGNQPLRAFGTDRFLDRNSFVVNLEYRKRVATVHEFSTQINIELTPFIDMGRVFNALSTDPLSRLHKVAGFGVRGIAPPFVVGYVDAGYGSEGFAVFTGLNYPF